MISASNLRSKWQAEKDIVEKIQQSNKKLIEDYKLEADRAERDGDFGKVAELRYGKIKEAENELEAMKVQLEELQGDNPMINEEVGAEEIADIVSKWTGIPVNRMLQSEREKLLHLEDELHKQGCWPGCGHRGHCRCYPPEPGRTAG